MRWDVVGFGMWMFLNTCVSVIVDGIGGGGNQRAEYSVDEAGRPSPVNIFRPWMIE